MERGSMDSTVAKLKKNASTEIWICLRKFESRQYIDIREHFFSIEDSQWRPTRRGVMVVPEVLTKLVDGITTLESATEIGTLATISKSKHSEVQIGYRQFGKHRYGEIRLWYRAKETAEMKPSQKGVTFRPELAASLIAALTEAGSYLASHVDSANEIRTFQAAH